VTFARVTKSLQRSWEIITAEFAERLRITTRGVKQSCWSCNEKLMLLAHWWAHGNNVTESSLQQKMFRLRAEELDLLRVMILVMHMLHLKLSSFRLSPQSFHLFLRTPRDLLH
jgi:hypothetical protein